MLWAMSVVATLQYYITHLIYKFTTSVRPSVCLWRTFWRVGERGAGWSNGRPVSNGKPFSFSFALKRLQEDKTLLEQYYKTDQVFINGKLHKAQSEQQQRRLRTSILSSKVFIVLATMRVLSKSSTIARQWRLSKARQEAYIASSPTKTPQKQACSPPFSRWDCDTGMATKWISRPPACSTGTTAVLDSARQQEWRLLRRRRVASVDASCCLCRVQGTSLNMTREPMVCSTRSGEQRSLEAEKERKRICLRNKAWLKCVASAVCGISITSP